MIFRLVSGAGDIKLTKDGNVLLHEMVKQAMSWGHMSAIFFFSKSSTLLLP